MPLFAVKVGIEPGLITVAKKTSQEDRGKLSEIENAFGATPLHIAVAHNHLKVVQILIENGASVNKKLTLGYDWSRGNRREDVVGEFERSSDNG